MLYQRWSRELGLATSPLFAHGSSAHTAMLDGVAGSFVLSDSGLAEFDSLAPDLGASWSWSSMMRHHVLVTNDVVTVSPSNGGNVELVARTAIEADLERFLRYLEDRASKSVTDVVDHVIAAFQGLRTRIDGPAEQQLTKFLALIALRLEQPNVPVSELPDLIDGLEASASLFDLADDAIGDIRIDRDLAARFYDQLLTDRRTGHGLRIDLTVRHAGAELFQAAHLAPPVAPAQGELLGLPTRAFRVRPHSLKDVAYTPVGLARSLSDSTLARCRPGPDGVLTIMDPACGSGSFLVEAIASLRRMGWNKPVRLVGYDISAAAVASARFALACAKLDAPAFRVDSVVEQRNFLDQTLETPAADVVLMNPPFRAWTDMDVDQQSAVREALGPNYRGRPDLSMAFVQRAVDISASHAIISALLPAGVLGNESAAAWRPALAKLAPPRLVGVLGDHSLFRFATVNVSALILDKADAKQEPGRNAPDEVQMMWASERPGAASAALRALRRESRGGILVTAPGEQSQASSWSLYPLAISALARKPNWLPAPGLLSATEREALAAIETRVGDLFAVRTGVRAGERDAFILSESQFRSLPLDEREAFRPIAEKRQIANGMVTPTDYLFDRGEEVEDEGELQRLYPAYYERHLLPWKGALEKRARAKRWWRQSEARNRWRASREPRILSRQWVKNDGYAVDPTGQFAVVQAYAWFPLPALKMYAKGRDEGLVELLRLYTVLLSSDIFFSIAREYSTNAGGGQIALQQKYLLNVPLPNLGELLNDKPHLIDMIINWENEFPALRQRNAFASACYKFPDRS